MLTDDMPPEFNTFLGYFQSTWIFGNPLRHNSTPRNPPQTWNVRERTLSLLNRTNNHVEAFLQYGGSSVTWNSNSRRIYNSIMTCVLVGERPPKRKKTYILKDNRIFHACQQYGELNLIEYLDLLMKSIMFLDVDYHL